MADAAAAGLHPPRVAAPALCKAMLFTETIFFYHITKSAPKMQ